MKCLNIVCVCAREIKDDDKLNRSIENEQAISTAISLARNLKIETNPFFFALQQVKQNTRSLCHRYPTVNGKLVENPFIFRGGPLARSYHIDDFGPPLKNQPK